MPMTKYFSDLSFKAFPKEAPTCPSPIIATLIIDYPLDA
jgi:hypothetical protein